jgi:hypothetical protein
MPRKNFGKLMEFFLKGLNPFKIQTRFKLELVLNFIIQNLEGFGSWAKKRILFYLKFSITLSGLEMFESMEVTFPILQVGK